MFERATDYDYVEESECPVIIAGIETPLRYTYYTAYRESGSDVPDAVVVTRLQEHKPDVWCPGCGWNEKKDMVDTEDLKYHLEHCKEIDF